MLTERAGRRIVDSEDGRESKSDNSAEQPWLLVFVCPSQTINYLTDNSRSIDAQMRSFKVVLYCSAELGEISHAPSLFSYVGDKLRRYYFGNIGTGKSWLSNYFSIGYINLMLT